MLNLLRNFNVEEATLSTWVFKKRIKATNPIFTGHWVGISRELINEIKGFINNEKIKYTELIEYGLLSQNNESSLLRIGTDETEANKILTLSANQTAELKATDVKHLANCDFYSIKLVHDDTVLHCIKKTDSSWRTKKKKGLRSLAYKNNTLTVDDSPKFDIAKSFDFFIIENDIFIKSKRLFESILSYKQAHINNFEELTSEPEFQEIFNDINQLNIYVGTNAMQLRRASAIKQKSYYKNDLFMESLKSNAARFRLNLQFDENNKIIVTPQNCADIFQALLDHRLQSHYQEHLYDVPNALLVQ